MYNSSKAQTHASQVEIINVTAIDYRLSFKTLRIIKRNHAGPPPPPTHTHRVRNLKEATGEAMAIADLSGCFTDLVPNFSFKGKELRQN